MSEEQLIKNIGSRIVTLRKNRNLKQIELAYLVDMKDSSLRRLESGRTNPTVKTLWKIAKALKIDIRELFEPTE